MRLRISYTSLVSLTARTERAGRDFPTICPDRKWSGLFSGRPELRMFFKEFFARDNMPAPRYVCADSVAAAEAYNEQNKRECNQLHSAARYCDEPYYVASSLQSEVRL